jgi:integrase
LGIDATIHGIKLAEAEAQKISLNLMAGNFDWGKYTKADQQEKRTCGDWVEKFKEQFFSTGEYAKRLRTWQGDYWAVFKWLPMDVELTIGVMEKVIERSVPRSRTRKRYCQVMERIGKFAGIACDFTHLEGDYGVASLNPKTIPSDQEILDTYERITNPNWRLVYGILAAYGIRPSEIVNIDRGALPKLIVTGGKTGAREVYPIPAEWVEHFSLTSGELPTMKSQNSKDVNVNLCHAFKRLGVPFPPQTLRHAYCIRGILYGLPTEIGAAWAGHALDLHNRVYQRWLQEGTHKAVFEKYILGS